MTTIENDRLAQLFQLQLNQQKARQSNFERLTDEEKDSYLRDLCLFMIDELMEFMNRRSYKRHKIWEEPHSRKAQVFELVDVQKYLLVSALVLGVDATEWFESFVEKTDIVRERWGQDKWDAQDKVICCDIDDVLTEYERFKSNLLAAGLSESEVKENIEEQCGYLILNPKLDNISVLQQLKEEGYHIVLMTSRRAWKVDSIHSETAKWLSTYNVPYEAILWGYDKAESISKRLRDTLPEFAIENSRKHAIDIADLGIKVYFVQNGREPLEYPNVVSIDTLSAISELKGAVHV